MTRDEAIQVCLTAGIALDDITDADLAAAGYTAPDPTATMPAVTPALTDDQVTQDVNAAQTEAADNTLSAQVLQGVEKAAEVAGTLVGKTIVP